jgi:hypothetical protein
VSKNDGDDRPYCTYYFALLSRKVVCNFHPCGHTETADEDDLRAYDYFINKLGYRVKLTNCPACYRKERAVEALKKKAMLI